MQFYFTILLAALVYTLLDAGILRPARE